jgi:YD repeat-containing protein
LVSEQSDGRVERRFTYGYLDKVLEVERPGGRSARYDYDAAGMLIRKATVAGEIEPGSGPKTETWVWDGLALVQRGNDYYVNEPHLAGGQTLLSKSLSPESVGKP